MVGPPAVSLKNPPWLFGLLSIPWGAFNGIVTLLMPFLLSRRGVPVDRIAGVVAVASIPNVWYFLWSPAVDLGLARRTWILLAAGFSAAAAWIAVADSSLSLAALTALLVAASAVAILLSSACGAILTALPPAVHGRASGWYQAGSLGGGALGAGLTIWLAGQVAPPLVATAAAALVFLPALAALWVREERPPRMALATLFRTLFRDIGGMLWCWPTLAGLVFFLSPVGSSAAANLISSLGPDYHASAGEVAFVSGAAGGVISALGCMLAGLICDRIGSMTTYAFAGLLAAASAAWMGFGPATPLTYGAGYAGYALAQGVAYAAFTALELDVLGKRRHDAGTAYALLGASGNLPIIYMTWLDGVAYKHGGRGGLMGADAAANGLGAVLLLLFAAWRGHAWLRRPRERTA